jgi:hypothetical protein
MLKRITAPVFVFVSESPTDPSYGIPDWAPALPGHDLPWAPGYPSHGLPGGGHISTGPIYGGGYPSQGLPLPPVHVGGKPPGRPILPPHPDNGLPPANHVWWGGGGRWEILDPGPGQPPILGYFPIDPGFGIPESPPVVGGGPITPGGGGGNWVPTDPDYGIPGCPGGKPHPPLWAWVPKPPDLVATPK